MNIPKQRMELIRKVGLFGLSDLRKLAPIGDLGYLNASSFYRGNYPLAGLLDDMMRAFYEQRKRFGWTVEGRSSKWRNSDNSYSCPELQMQWAIDSGD